MAAVGGMRDRGFALPPWLRLRVVGAVVLVIICAFAGSGLLGRSAPSPRYWATSHALAAGTVLTSDDLTLVSQDLAGSAHSYLAAPDSPAGQSLVRAVGTALGPVPAGTSVLIPLTAATSPALHRGQRIRLWASTPLCPLAVVLPDATVQDVSTASAGGFGVAGSQRVVVLAGTYPSGTDAAGIDLAARVITARSLSGVVLRAAVLEGPPVAVTTALPDLSSCQSS
jgi:hypothetical protein